MTISSREITILVLGLFFSILLSFVLFSKKFEFNNFQTIYAILVITLILIGIIIWAFHKKGEENKQELEYQKIEQKKLGEKLKIHEQLIDLKVEIKELQKKVFKK